MRLRAVRCCFQHRRVRPPEAQQRKQQQLLQNRPEHRSVATLLFSGSVFTAGIACCATFCGAADCKGECGAATLLTAASLAEMW